MIDGGMEDRVGRPSGGSSVSPVRATAFLRNVPVLAGLSDELLERLGDQLREVHVPAGEWILREGETADSLFIVRGGRVDVLDEGPPAALIRVLRRGDVLGELALLRAGTRSVSARARRDVELLELGRAEFEALIAQAPGFALGLTRSLGAQLAASRTPVVAATPPQTVVVVGLDDGAPVAEVARSLAAALDRLGSVASLSEGGLSTIDQAERDADRVVMEAGLTPDDEWTSICLREAHLVVAVTTGQPGSVWRGHATALQGCELLVLAPEVSPEVVADLEPREVQVLAEEAGRQAALEATARADCRPLAGNRALRWWSASDGSPGRD
jgi:NTE family protein